jgi:hypothetical protein
MSVGVAAGINALGTEAVLEGKKARAFPLRFVEGTVFLGPLKVGQVPALYRGLRVPDAAQRPLGAAAQSRADISCAQNMDPDQQRTAIARRRRA